MCCAREILFFARNLNKKSRNNYRINIGYRVIAIAIAIASTSKKKFGTKFTI